MAILNFINNKFSTRVQALHLVDIPSVGPCLLETAIKDLLCHKTIPPDYVARNVVRHATARIVPVVTLYGTMQSAVVYEMLIQSERTRWTSVGGGGPKLNQH